MAVVPRVATLRLDDTASHATNVLQWVATAVVQDTTAGQSVVITTVRTTAGVPPADPETLTLRLDTDAPRAGGLGVVVRSFPLDVTAASQTSTFFFTADGTSTGSEPRAGTLEIVLRATRTAAPTYDVDTDGTPNTPPTGFDAHLDRGWVRGTTTAATSLSNVAPGGAKATPAEYDESLFTRTTLGAALYVARTLTVAIPAATPALSGLTNPATSGNFDATFSGVVDDRFPAAVTSLSTSLAVPNAILTDQPDTVLTATGDSITVDPRLTASHHFQVDDNALGRSKNDTSRSMLSTQTGFVATRLVTARTQSGVNGVALTQTITPTAPGVAVGPTATVTATRDSEAGWSELLAWAASKPGGAWTKVADLTTADIDADPHLLGGTDTLTMLAPDPRVSVMVAFGPTAASEDDHLHPGDATAVTVTAFDRGSGRRLVPDVGSVIARLVRWNRSTARFEYLAADGLAWLAWTGSTTVADQHLLTDAGDGVTFSRTVTSTAAWTATDIVAVQVNLKIGGTPYGFYVGRELTGAANSHAGYSVDPVGLALAGIVSQR